jgi:hypothetical protein
LLTWSGQLRPQVTDISRVRVNLALEGSLGSTEFCSENHYFLPIDKIDFGFRNRPLRGEAA